MRNSMLRHVLYVALGLVLASVAACGGASGATAAPTHAVSAAKTTAGQGQPTTTVVATNTIATGTAGGAATANPSKPGDTPPITMSVTPNAALQACPAAVSLTSYWDSIVKTQPGVSQVSSVTCDALTGDGSQQALVQVAYNGTQNLDVYVYNNISNANPTSILGMQNLLKGAARISNYHTLMTAEVDANSSINSNVDPASTTQDLFREFKWSDQVGGFVPTSFPGLFPDLTRFQAEGDQQDVSQGHQPWKLDAQQVAQAMTVSLLKWPANSATTLVSGGGAQDTAATVDVKSPTPGGSTIRVNLSRLEGNTNYIWEVTDVGTDNMSITMPVSRDLLTSPQQVAGKGNAFEAVIGNVVVLDHLYNDIGHAQAMGATGNGNTTFSTTVTYTSSFKMGDQEGIVALYAPSNANGAIAGVVMLKELLS